jgi:hypothetical protein
MLASGSATLGATRRPPYAVAKPMPADHAWSHRPLDSALASSRRRSAGIFGLARAARHFYASWSINRKLDGGLELPIKVVQGRLGHASITMTADVYGHLFPRGDDADELAAAEQAFLRIPSLKAVWTGGEWLADIGVECDTVIVSTKR